MTCQRPVAPSPYTAWQAHPSRAGAARGVSFNASSRAGDGTRIVSDVSEISAPKMLRMIGGARADVARLGSVLAGLVQRFKHSPMGSRLSL